MICNYVERISSLSSERRGSLSDHDLLRYQGQVVRTPAGAQRPAKDVSQTFDLPAAADCRIRVCVEVKVVWSLLSYDWKKPYLELAAFP